MTFSDKRYFEFCEKWFLDVHYPGLGTRVLSGHELDKNGDPTKFTMWCLQNDVAQYNSIGKDGLHSWC